MKNKLYAVVLTALLTALATVVFLFNFTIPIAGVQAVRVSFSEPFIRLAAVLFGPVFGGIASGLLDVLGMIVKPIGAWIPPITLTAVLNGVLAGFVWKLVKKASEKKLTIAYLSVTAFCILMGAGVWIASRFPNTPMGELTELFGAKVSLLVICFLFAAGLGLVLLFIAWLIGKKTSMPMDLYLRCAVTVAIPGIIISIANSYLLKMYISTLASKGILIIMLPRLAETVATIPIQAYILAVLMIVYQKSKFGKGRIG